MLYSTSHIQEDTIRRAYPLPCVAAFNSCVEIHSVGHIAIRMSHMGREHVSTAADEAHKSLEIQQ